MQLRGQPAGNACQSSPCSALTRRCPQERLTLKHKNTSRWARRALRRGQTLIDEGTRQAVAEQLRLGEELRQRVSLGGPAAAAWLGHAHAHGAMSNTAAWLTKPGMLLGQWGRAQRGQLSSRGRNRAGRVRSSGASCILQQPEHCPWRRSIRAGQPHEALTRQRQRRLHFRFRREPLGIALCRGSAAR